MGNRLLVYIEDAENSYSEKKVWLDNERLTRVYRSTRETYVSDSYVVKIEERDDIYKFPTQCEQEWEKWKRIYWTEHKDLFAPIIKYGACSKWDFVIQPRLFFDENPNPLHTENIWKKRVSPTARKYEVFDISFNPITMKFNNWGIVRKQPIIYDYGV